MNNWEEEVNKLAAELDINLDGISPPYLGFNELKLAK